MPARPRSADHGKSRRQLWEEAASHRDPDEKSERSDERPATGAPEPDDAFLNTRDGVFYPGGHAVLLLAPDDARALRDALADAGFGSGDTRLLAPREAAARMRDSEEQAGMLSRIVRAELKNASVMRKLADDGAAMLIVRIDGEAQEDALVQTARRWTVRKALRYHALAIEELRLGAEEIPGESPYGVNEVLRRKPSDARLKPRNRRRGEGS